VAGPLPLVNSKGCHAAWGSNPPHKVKAQKDATFTKII
jgi:hypothetical protein